MDLYTVDPYNYNRDTIIDEYESVVWTERFIDPGDIRLVLPATSETVKLGKPGTLIGMQTAREIMVIDTRSIENGKMTATGKTIDVLFNDRFISGRTIINTPGLVLKDIVQKMQDRWGSKYAIPGIVMGSVADISTSQKEVIKHGPASEELLRVAKKHNVGMALYWTANNSGGHDFVFSTRAGEDRRDQILFSPQLDNFANVKEVLSDVDYKNVVIIRPPKHLPFGIQIDPIHVSDITYGNTVPTFTRIVEIVCDDDDDIEEMREKPALGPPPTYLYFDHMAEIKAKMRTQAKTLLRKLKKTKVVDGEITPETQYKYYTEYNPYGDPEYRLGDKVKIGGHFTASIDGIVTEYIQSSDSTGERAYPTVVPLADYYSSTSYEETKDDGSVSGYLGEPSQN